MIISSNSVKPLDDLKSLPTALVIIIIMIAILPQVHNVYGQNDIAKQDYGTASCNCVAFRLDDIQDYFLTNPQMEVINTFEKNNASLTVGVIGNSFGYDKAILSFISSKLSDSNNNTSGNFAIEIANHGWNHEDFTSFSKVEQSHIMQQTNNKIMDTLGVKPIVFIPPYNSLNSDTIAALQENGFQYFSGNASSYPASLLQAYENKSAGDNGSDISESSNATIFHFPSSAFTGDLNADNTEWLGYSHDSTFAALNASMNKLGYAVVTMHPMEFSVRNGTMYQNKVDDLQIQELELLIEDIRDAGFKIVTISQINEGYGSVIPEFSSYSIYAILTISIVMTILLSTKSNLFHGRLR